MRRNAKENGFFFVAPQRKESRKVMSEMLKGGSFLRVYEKRCTFAG
jgi:hypothetical protein